MIEKIFRRCLEDALEKLPFQTKSGQVDKGRPDFPHLGSPGGSHSIDRFLCYIRNGTNLQMYFSFYKNFSDDDLLCKVFSSWGDLYSGMGASVQFNAHRCVDGKGTIAYLRHDGRVTIKKPILRSKLISHIEAICPQEMKLARISGEWPVMIGTTTNIPDLINNIFVYAHCIEQAKRIIRSEGPLELFAKTS